MDKTSADCEVCGRPGFPSWGESVLCEDCYGMIGATCAGRPRNKEEKKTNPEPDQPVC